MEFEFAKNATVASLDTVPEPFRGFYAEGEGGFALNDSFKATAASVDGLNKSLKAARREADEGKRNRPDLTQYAAVGQLLGLEADVASDPTALLTAAETVIRQSKDGQVNWDKMKGTLEQGFNAKLQAKDQELQGMGSTLQKYLINSAAVTAIAANKGIPDLLLPHIQAKTKVIKDGDEYVVRVVDETGDPRGNASGGFMTVEDLVKELKASPVFGRAFDSEAPSGTGSRPNTGTNKPAVQKGEKTSMDKISAGLEKRNR